MNETHRPQRAASPQSQSVPQDATVRPASRPAAQSGDESQSLSELLSGVVENLQNIVRSEVQLAKTEMREEAKTAGKAAGMLAAGAALGFYALGLFLMTAVWILATQMDNWLAALIVTVVVGIIAAVLLMKGKSQLQEVHPIPEQTVESVKEDVEWVKQQTR